MIKHPCSDPRVLLISIRGMSLLIERMDFDQPPVPARGPASHPKPSERPPRGIWTSSPIGSGPNA